MKKIIANESVSAYIAALPKESQMLVKEIRRTIKKLVPDAKEVMRYGIPTFQLNGNLIHYAGYKKHIGLYPGSFAIRAFKKELTTYATSKGTIQFPLDKKLPISLITKITRFCVTQQRKKKK